MDQSIALAALLKANGLTKTEAQDVWALLKTRKLGSGWEDAWDAVETLADAVKAKRGAENEDS